MVTTTSDQAALPGRKCKVSLSNGTIVYLPNDVEGENDSPTHLAAGQALNKTILQNVATKPEEQDRTVIVSGV